MQWKRKYCLGLLLVFACIYNLSAQSTQVEDIKVKEDVLMDSTAVRSSEKPFSVRYIVIEGNKKTKADIILREIPFKSGEKYLLPDLVQKFEVARRQLMNTSLFHEAIVALKSFDGYNKRSGKTYRTNRR